MLDPTGSINYKGGSGLAKCIDHAIAYGHTPGVTLHYAQYAGGRCYFYGKGYKSGKAGYYNFRIYKKTLGSGKYSCDQASKKFGYSVGAPASVLRASETKLAATDLTLCQYAMPQAAGQNALISSCPKTCNTCELCKCKKSEASPQPPPPPAPPPFSPPAPPPPKSCNSTKKSVAGKASGQYGKCVFPFEYGNYVYSSCAMVEQCEDDCPLSRFR